MGRSGAALLFGFGLLAPERAFAARGEPHEWQVWHQDPVTPVAAQLDDLHLWLLILSVAICGLVFCLIGYVLLRFNERANPTPARTAHNTLLEIVWTTLPVLILISIAVPSFKLLYFMDRTAEAEMTLKVTGHQWYWEYAYPDHDELSFAAVMVEDEELQPGQRRLLETDNRVVLPVDTNIRILVTASDVLHSWGVPSLAMKVDAVPGRINETWARVTEPGVYYGQCSEICGLNHAYMPIAIEAVSKPAFDEWIAARQREAGRPTTTAALRQKAP